MQPSEPTAITVERTAKKWKAMRLMGGALAVLGVVCAVTASTTIGAAFLIGGTGVSLYARLAAWWHHG